ncbi:MAG: response regulator [Candidatus Eisenbacteria bacterium]|uniref:histidine kinase n=1 Tax=Eiseniibacteriota bacterium TaxID=2212470 RepID=A0A9D6LAK9_UNCEI|nr:response regulator [Candidatus Eisenbacteria bacterium]MBI3539927.1 response regulator [Candidatus Eisenbacteria bacterium]
MHAHAPDPTAARRGPDGAPAAEPARVLVVDDEASVVEVFEEFLSTQGYRLTMAANGEQAVKLLPSLKPDIILTDLNLPGVSGLEVMRAAKRVDPEVCVVVVTGYASASTAIDALRQGAYDYVTKPFDLEDVLQIIERGLANRRLRLLNHQLIEELREKNEILRRHEHELTERVRLATSQMTSLYEVGKEISANLALEPRLAVISARAAERCGARAAIVYLAGDRGGVLHPASAFGAERTLVEAEIADGGGFLGHAISGRGPMEHDAGVAGAPIELPGIAGQWTTALAVPMVDDQQVIGMLVVLDKPGGFSDDDSGFLVLFASQAAIAVRNSQLFEHTKSLDRLKSEFVAVVSHEIRTPLTSVKGAVELLADEHYFRNNEQQSKLLSIAHANAERLLVLINDILDFSKLESSSLPMNVERQRVEPVITQAMQNLRTQIEEHRLQLEMVLSPELPDLMIDPVRIAQVLTNLVSNAIKFSPPGGRIEITAEPWDGVVRVGVRDHGEGIAAKDLPKLFRKFSQIDSSATRKAGGTGLGLVICKGLIEQHGGQMSVESAPGEGSTFYFTLPPADASAPAVKAHD